MGAGLVENWGWLRRAPTSLLGLEGWERRQKPHLTHQHRSPKPYLPLAGEVRKGSWASIKQSLCPWPPGGRGREEYDSPPQA